MKLITITIAIAASVASAALVGCSGHGHDGFDTNGAEMSAYPGDAGRRPGETNGEAAARVGKEVYVFKADKAQAKKMVATAPEKQEAPTEHMDTSAPVTAAEEQEVVDTTYQTTTASSVEQEQEAPKSKKDLRKEKRDARKAKKNN